MIFHRISSAINLAGLTIGMTAAFLIFMWVKNEYSYDSFHPDAENIYRLTKINEIDPAQSDERTPFLLGEKVKVNVPDVELLARIYPLNVFPPTVKSGQQIFKDRTAAYADKNWFKVFRFKFIKGSADSFNSTRNSVVLSESNAKKYFGSVDPIGKTLEVNGSGCIVHGVIEDYPSNSSFRYGLLISDSMRPVNLRMRQNMVPSDSYQTFIKLNSTSSTSVTLKKINAVSGELKIDLIKLKDIHFETLGFSFLQHGDQKLTNVLFFLGLLLLAIACINYVNLTTAKSSARIKEVSIKKITGAGSKQLFLQFFIESLLIIIIALTAAIILIWIALPFFNRFTDNNFILSFRDLSFWQVIIGTTLCTTLLASIYPALLLSSFKPITALRKASSMNSIDSRLRKSLIVLQFAISVTLIIGTIVIYRQMQFVKKQYDNYDKHHLFSFVFRSALEGDERIAEMDAVRAELMSNSSVRSVALTSGRDIINIPNAWAGFDWNGRNSDINTNIDFIQVGSNLDQIAMLKLKEGRWFGEAKIDRKNFILNETAVKELGIKQPVIGQRFSLDQDTGRVIGVIKDFHYVEMHTTIGPLVIGNNHDNANAFIVKTAVGRQIDALAHTEAVLKRFKPDQPFDFQFANDEFDRLYRTDQRSASLIWLFSILAIFISCLGLYGLATFTAERRIKEIGIRKVLGASVQNIIRMVSSDFIKLVLISMLIAFPLGWWVANKWLQNFVYHIQIQWWVFVLSGVLAIVIAVMTVSFQAIKAALMNPVRSLRSE